MQIVTLVCLAASHARRCDAGEAGAQEVKKLIIILACRGKGEVPEVLMVWKDGS